MERLTELSNESDRSIISKENSRPGDAEPHESALVQKRTGVQALDRRTDCGRLSNFFPSERFLAQRIQPLLFAEARPEREPFEETRDPEGERCAPAASASVVEDEVEHARRRRDETRRDETKREEKRREAKRREEKRRETSKCRRKWGWKRRVGSSRGLPWRYRPDWWSVRKQASAL
ncbi:hypothetical protein V1477_015318 [Vespula maculifrons]|uniref:Uncharacterized protein n=1 Tax=Vespula maculifrons TaxID=7453 RepID=A0ABD2BFG9_VESMC